MTLKYAIKGPQNKNEKLRWRHNFEKTIWKLFEVVATFRSYTRNQSTDEQTYTKKVTMIILVLLFDSYWFEIS